ncbi:hypothetical protein Desde_3089 [Desulfitobacterium dehalogenans ATCC 51507]|uniref:Uncharacterized protein n=1 Tax=Desulfitobacterium dehalogenans (strain ATCC 51507 / DSM 9161 / JW/IU-DC1) TaxID=756499 RepID=I4ABP8_DESDJ|nr:hypothetical protein [Desulfitobacterium dehalogenans]AFM01383.1 hypothetical protein Desde_3089 [Desulfitobacterium dehalogenans ATCC 51507]
MRGKKRLIPLVLFVIIFLSIPLGAFAAFDDYGYNPQGRMFKGTLENWEAFLHNQPAVSWDPKATDVIFLERKWDKLFDPMLRGDIPLPGAWQKAKLWQYLSGEQAGWTWHQELEVVYSPNQPIAGAMELTANEMGIPGFYCVTFKEWQTGPKGQKVVIDDLSVNSGIIQKALKFTK